MVKGDEVAQLTPRSKKMASRQTLSENVDENEDRSEEPIEHQHSRSAKSSENAKDGSIGNRDDSARATVKGAAKGLRGTTEGSDMSDLGNYWASRKRRASASQGENRKRQRNGDVSEGPAIAIGKRKTPGRMMETVAISSDENDELFG